MKIVAVTTFNESGYELYGRRMIETFIQKWEVGVRLVVYYEGWTPPEDNPFVEYRDLTALDFWLKGFKERNARRNRPQGFKHDAIRFSHKVAALTHAALDKTIDYLIWLDGDVVTHSMFTYDDIEPLLPNEQWIAWLDRAKCYPECGFYIINCNHPDHVNAMSTFQAMYAGDYLFNLPEWHDSYVLEHVVKSLNVPVKSLSGKGFRTHHPLVNSPLGKWFDHLKGARKQKGKSHAYDLAAPREEAYWRGK